MRKQRIFSFLLALVIVFGNITFGKPLVSEAASRAKLKSVKAELKINENVHKQGSTWYVMKGKKARILVIPKLSKKIKLKSSKSFKSSNKKVISVSKSGVITAKKSGKVTIYITLKTKKSKRISKSKKKTKIKIVSLTQKKFKDKFYNRSDKWDEEDDYKPYTVQYNYKLSFFNQPYAKTDGAYFLKTNNPDHDRYRVYFKHSSGKYNTYSGGRDYHDLALDTDNCITYPRIVKGGFVDAEIFQLPGEYSVIIEEYPKGQTKFSYYESARKVIGKIKVLDYRTEKNIWMDNIINSVTTKSMTKRQKLRAIADHLYSITKYYKNYNNEYGGMEWFLLITESGIPDFKLLEFDSFTSPYLLAEFANKIDYPVRILFGDYERGTDDWWMYHSYVKSEEDDEYFGFCHTSDSNFYPDIHSRDDIKKIDCLKYDSYYECY